MFRLLTRLPGLLSSKGAQNTSSTSSQLLPFSDFIINQFRKQLDPWFEVVEYNPYSKDLNTAVLSDGNSSLLLRFNKTVSVSSQSTSTTSSRYGNHCLTFTVQDIPLTIVGNFLNFSHRDFETGEFELITKKAIALFQSQINDDGGPNKVSRLAFEINFDPEIDMQSTNFWLDQLADSLGGNWESSPRFNLSYGAPSNFKYHELKGIRWAQMILHEPVDPRTLIPQFQPLFENAESITSDHILRLYSNQQMWKQYQIRNVTVRTRQY